MFLPLLAFSVLHYQTQRKKTTTTTTKVFTFTGYGGVLFLIIFPSLPRWSDLGGAGSPFWLRSCCIESTLAFQNFKPVNCKGLCCILFPFFIIFFIIFFGKDLDGEKNSFCMHACGAMIGQLNKNSCMKVALHFAYQFFNSGSQ